MVISWGTVKSLLLFFGPILLPKAIGYYRSIRQSASRANLPVQPTPPAVKRVLALLVAAVAILLALAVVPTLVPENVFITTGSRLQIPVDTLFHRLALNRSDQTLTPRDEALRARFVNMESRLLYLQYGPAVLADCPFCSSDEPLSYLYYALADVLAPHILNLAVITLATSNAIAGRSGAGWRTSAMFAAVAMAVADTYFVSTYKHLGNKKALKLSEIDFFYWTARATRLAALAGLDLLLATLLWLTATNRAFVEPPTPAERVDTVTRLLGVTKSKLNAMGIVRNTANRDEELRRRSQAYWQHEVRLMGDVMEEREVVDSVTNALENRINIETITQEAEKYAQNVLPPLQQATATVQTKVE